MFAAIETGVAWPCHLTKPAIWMSRRVISVWGSRRRGRSDIVVVAVLRWTGRVVVWFMSLIVVAVA